MQRALCLASFLLAASVMPRAAEADVRVASYEKPDVTIDLYGWTQPRFTYELTVDSPGFTLPQTRLGVIGGLGKWGRVQTEINVGTIDLTLNPSGPELLDAYGVFTPYRSRAVGVDVTLGRFRVPFSRQNLIQPMGLQLPDAVWFAEHGEMAGRQLGGMLGIDFFDRKVRLMAGVFAGADRDHENWFLYAGRLEIEPLGPAPRFEGDVRAVELRRRPVLSIGASAVTSPRTTKESFTINARVEADNVWLGADAGVWYAGASLYGEFYFRSRQYGEPFPSLLHLAGWNVQAGYFPPLPFLREHVEIAARVESFSRYEEFPTDTPPIRDTTWFAWSAGLNFFVDRGHALKMQVSYKGDFHGDDVADRLTLQATAGF
ncbi:hypothetical protein [Polyangium aurulentum]|uniref:hypothetical protein n=1 Tax=Polyangium aurulentum TaxID=2567896 RepID=UPI0010AEC8A1|nr:hypothetical protein [Polyangium aurulentum]UQA59667.1 OprO/OprP family phosphate-selective porin [Polyangium aurulentum]